MTDEYISRHAALDALGATKNATKYGGDHSGHDTRMLYEIHDVLTGIPAADVAQVVRCKDCEWAIKSTELPGWYMCKCKEAFDYYAKPDDFCSHGKRREE